MKIELPGTRPYGAAFVLGARILGGTPQRIGSVIVKAGYLLVGAGSGAADTHRMVPDLDAAASALLLADQGSTGTDGMDVAREADIAPYKPVPDIVVEGFLSGLGASGAEIRVDVATWISRLVPDPALPAIHLADRNRHLFGYQPRSLAPRAGEAGSPLSGPVPDPPEPGDFPLRDPAPQLGDILGYENRVLNFHRRGGGFSASSSVAGALAAGQRIAVRKAGTEAFSVTLALPPLHALYRTWCGHGPDAAPYWTRMRLGPMRADTLILRPEADRAEVIWRSVWPWEQEAEDSYRAIRVTEEAV